MIRQSGTNGGGGGGGFGKFLRIGLAAVAGLLAPAGLYMGVVWSLGLMPHPELTAWHYGGGGALATVVAIAIAIMGESLIEDVVKFAFIAIGALAVWHSFGPGVSVVYLGTVVGASMSLVVRAVGKMF